MDTMLLVTVAGIGFAAGLLFGMRLLLWITSLAIVGLVVGLLIAGERHDGKAIWLFGATLMYLPLLGTPALAAAIGGHVVRRSILRHLEANRQ
ncbi:MULTISPECIES: hypothetical protein [Xanthomonas]|uniref:hypothetical protein n=1 Tax=Xanthomonas TaxID=338 RepID=UPI001ADADD9D|nr:MULTISPECIES: hypothetical protein [unclassified Xanthomonas]MBO9875207.1 hypothetical protein [Xanthomonas sp. D-93]WNH45588.1 hypothetical protein PG878_03710 [Xanthomonas sp. A6251]